MQTVTPALRSAMEATSVESYPEAVLEFDHSLMGEATVNAPDSINEELFPKESVISQRFVGTGLPRAIVGQCYARDESSPVQFRAVDESDTYKYWVSPKRGGALSIDDAWMEVTYDRDRPTNKLYIAFDVSYDEPRDVDIDIMKNGQWEQAYDNYRVISDGLIVLYPQSNGEWTKDYNTEHPQNVGGIRVTVNRVGGNAYAHIIAISARYRLNMSERVTNMSINKNLENVSVLTPMGDTSVNSIDLSFENEDGLLDPENNDSPFYRLLSRNVRVDASVSLPGHDSISQGTFFAESWNYSAPSVELGLSATDFSRFMQEINLPPFVLRNYTVQDAVREILQRAGFNIDGFETKSNPVVPFVWYSEDVTVWEALKDLAAATMSYFYVNEKGEFLWVDLDIMKDRGVVETLNASENLVSLDHNFDVIANSINIEYNIYGSPVDPVSGENITQELWTPPDDEALLSEALHENMSPTSNFIRIRSSVDDMELWPEKGIVYIQGERIRYNAKDDANRLLIDLERGALGTNARSHVANNAGALTSRGRRGSRTITSAGNLRITGPAKAQSKDYNYVVWGNLNTEHKVYGTSVMFPRRTLYETAGLVINRRGSLGGIYIEISTTRMAVKNNRDEIRVYRRGPRGNSYKVYDTAPYEVARSNWYDLEVLVEYTQNNPVYTVFCNGMFVTSFMEHRTPGGRFGCYTRGETRADFARLYVSDSDGSTIGRRHFQDVRSGSSFSSDYVWESEDPNISINEFAPRVRQVKEFDIDFDKSPATAASIMLTNVWQARAFKFVPGPFGATFYIENKSDSLAVIHGRSPNLFDEEMDMTTLVYGDPVVVASEENKKIRDHVSIRKNGRVELEVSNPWIQTDEMADNLGEMIKDNFSEPMDTVTVDVFPDYSIQLGDILAVDYEEHGYNIDTHQYYVLSAELSWSNGFSQSLTLRRKR